MSKALKIAAFLLVFIALTNLLPHSIAHREQLRRDALLRLETSQFLADSLSDCPRTGPDLDAFLLKEQSPTKESNVWKPLCRVPDLPLDKVSVVLTHRNQLDSCGHRWTPSNLNCSLTEPLVFLSDPRDRYTWARLQLPDSLKKQMIWMSSRPMAWNEHLVAEYQNRIQWILITLMGLILTGLLTVRLKRSIEEQQMIHEVGQPIPPRAAEILLISLAAPRPWMLADTNQEYYEMLETGLKKKFADRWYRTQVLCSLPHLALHSLKNLVKNAL